MRCIPSQVRFEPLSTSRTRTRPGIQRAKRPGRRRGRAARARPCCERNQGLRVGEMGATPLPVPVLASGRTAGITFAISLCRLLLALAPLLQCASGPRGPGGGGIDH
jgi:hypothetical protein